MNSKGKWYRSMHSSCAFTSGAHFNLGQRDLKCPHKMKQFLDTGERRNKTAKSDYGSQKSELKGRARDAIYQKDVPPGHAAEASTIIWENGVGVSETVPTFMVQFKDILHCVAK